MPNPIISITSSSVSKESPVTAEYLTDVISEDLNKSSETNALIEFLLAKLQKKSSKHKFLIQATRLKSLSSIETNLNISTSFGAVWESNRDGYISLKVELKGDRDTEAEKKSDSTEESKEKVLDEKVNDNLNGEEKESEENTLEAGLNDNFNEDSKDVLSTTDINPQEADEGKTNEEDANGLKELPSTTDDDKFKESVNVIVGSEDNEEDLKEEAGSMEPIHDDSLKDDAVDSRKPEYMGQSGKAQDKDENDFPTVKKEVDSGTDSILVSVYWVFVG